MFRFFRHARERAVSERNSGKFLRYALGEIVLVVLGILIALQINNWNEDRKEQRQVAEYARALVDDLKADIAMLETVQRTATRVVRSAEDLRSYTRARPIEDLDNLHLAYLTTFVSYRPYSWNRSALQQLVNSGALRQMKILELVRMISKYDAFSRHLDQDYQQDSEESTAADALASEVVDTNYPDDGLFGEHTWRSPYAFPPTGLLEAYEGVNLELLTRDPAKLRTLVNAFSKLGNQVSVRVDMELPEQIEHARRLIALLEAEYPARPSSEGHVRQRQAAGAHGSG